MIFEPRQLMKALDDISERSDLYFLPADIEPYESEEVKSNFSYLLDADESEYQEIVLGMTKNMVVDFLLNLPELLDLIDEERVEYFLKCRYRRYVFRLLYIIWQDNFESQAFRNVMLYILNDPKTASYIEEVGFTVDELSSVVSSESMQTRLVELSLDLGVSAREFLIKRKISLTSYLAIDVLNVFFLFCSGEDFLAFGGTKLIWALERFDLRYQAKVINNLYSKLSGEKRHEMPELVRYIVRKHGLPSLKDQDDFWSLVNLSVIREVMDDYRAL